MRRAARALAAAAALGLAAPGAPAAGPALLAGPAAPGPDLPPVGRSLLEEAFPEGLPFPFEAVLDRLRGLAGAPNVQTALVPLGRSLQRYGGAPDFFVAPRLVVAVSGDGAAGPEEARLADRLFLGYQPAAEIVEAIAYNAAAGRFEFQEVVGYSADRTRAIEPAARHVCLVCHQAQGPIFARPLWNETNASPGIAALLAPLGPDFHGAPVPQSVDTLEAFDAATDRAARIALANRLWADGCPDPACRAALLAAAIRTGLGASPRPSAQAAAFRDRTLAIWPEGLAAVTPDLPNRDPLPLLASMDPSAIVETAGAANPETPRAAVPLWRPGPEAFQAAAREIAAQLAPGDLAWIERRTSALGGTGEVVSLPCATVAVGAETRFDCTRGHDRLTGFLAATKSGRIDSLSLAGQPPLHRIAVTARPEHGGTILRPAGRAPRLADGRRVAEVALVEGKADLRLTDDLGPLDRALAKAARSKAAALNSGPFDRIAVLALIGRLTGQGDG